MNGTKENPVTLAIETTKGARSGTTWVRKMRRYLAAMVGTFAFVIAGAGAASAQTPPTPTEETTTLVGGIVTDLLNAVKTLFVDAIVPAATVLTLLFVGTGIAYGVVWALGRKAKSAVSGS